MSSRNRDALRSLYSVPFYHPFFLFVRFTVLSSTIIIHLMSKGVHNLLFEGSGGDSLEELSL